MIIVAWKGHSGYYASGHSDQSSLISFQISIRCTAVVTKTDQTARMHKTVRYFYFVVHLRYMDPGETKKGRKNRMISGKIYITLDHMARKRPYKLIGFNCAISGN